MKRPHRKSQAIAFTFIEMLAVIAAIGLLAALLLPAVAKGRQRAQRIRCVSFLKQVGLSARQWALSHRNAYPWSLSVDSGGTLEHISKGEVWPHFQVMSNELNTPYVLVCPSDTERIRASDFRSNLSNTNLSYFVGVDSSDSMPQMVLAGDRNILGGSSLPGRILMVTTNDVVRWDNRMHKGQGNVALADGSVQGFSTSNLREALANTGAATNKAFCRPVDRHHAPGGWQNLSGHGRG